MGWVRTLVQIARGKDWFFQQQFSGLMGVFLGGSRERGCSMRRGEGGQSFLFRISAICNERTIPVSQSSSTMSSGTATRDNWRRTFAMQLKEKKQKDACLIEGLTHLHGGSHVAVGQKGVWSCPGSSEQQAAASRLASQTNRVWLALLEGPFQVHEKVTAVWEALGLVF